MKSNRNSRYFREDSPEKLENVKKVWGTNKNTIICSNSIQDKLNFDEIRKKSLFLQKSNLKFNSIQRKKYSIIQKEMNEKDIKKRMSLDIRNTTKKFLNGLNNNFLTNNKPYPNSIQIKNNFFEDNIEKTKAKKSPHSKGLSTTTLNPRNFFSNLKHALNDISSDSINHHNALSNSRLIILDSNFNNNNNETLMNNIEDQTKTDKIDEIENSIISHKIKDPCVDVKDISDNKKGKFKSNRNVKDFFYLHIKNYLALKKLENNYDYIIDVFNINEENPSAHSNKINSKLKCRRVSTIFNNTDMLRYKFSNRRQSMRLMNEVSYFLKKNESDDERNILDSYLKTHGKKDDINISSIKLGLDSLKENNFKLFKKGSIKENHYTLKIKRFSSETNIGLSKYGKAILDDLQEFENNINKYYNKNIESNKHTDESDQKEKNEEGENSELDQSMNSNNFQIKKTPIKNHISLSRKPRQSDCFVQRKISQKVIENFAKINQLDLNKNEANRKSIFNFMTNENNNNSDNEDDIKKTGSLDSEHQNIIYNINNQNKNISVNVINYMNFDTKSVSGLRFNSYEDESQEKSECSSDLGYSTDNSLVNFECNNFIKNNNKNAAEAYMKIYKESKMISDNPKNFIKLNYLPIFKKFSAYINKSIFRFKENKKYFPFFKKFSLIRSNILSDNKNFSNKFSYAKNQSSIARKSVTNFNNISSKEIEDFIQEYHKMIFENLIKQIYNGSDNTSDNYPTCKLVFTRLINNLKANKNEVRNKPIYHRLKNNLLKIFEFKSRTYYLYEILSSIRMPYKQGFNSISELNNLNNQKRMINIINEDKNNKSNIIKEKSKIKSGQKLVPGVFLPDSTFRVIWDMLISIGVIYNLLYIPIIFLSDVSNPDVTDRSTNAFDILIDTFFFIDIILNFRTGFIDSSNQIVVNLKDIRDNYLKFLFYFDLSSTIPYEFFISNRNIKLTNLLKLPRMLKIMRLTKLIEKFKYKNFFKLFYLFFIYFLLAHWLGCIFYLFIDSDFLSNNLLSKELESCIDIHSVSNNSGSDSLSNYNFPLDCKYFFSLFNGMSMMEAQYLTNTEWNFSQIIILSFEYFIGQVSLNILFSFMSSSFKNIDSTQKIYNDKMKLIKEHMELNDIKGSTKDNIEGFYEYIWNKHKNVIMRKQHINHITPIMKEKLSLFQFKQSLRFFNFLNTNYNLSDRIYGMLFKFMRLRVCLPNEMIFLEGDVSKGIYILSKGKAFNFISAITKLVNEKLAALNRKHDSYFSDKNFESEVNDNNFYSNNKTIKNEKYAKLYNHIQKYHQNSQKRLLKEDNSNKNPSSQSTGHKMKKAYFTDFNKLTKNCLEDIDKEKHKNFNLKSYFEKLEDIDSDDFWQQGDIRKNLNIIFEKEQKQKLDFYINKLNSISTQSRIIKNSIIEQDNNKSRIHLNELNDMEFQNKNLKVENINSNNLPYYPNPQAMFVKNKKYNKKDNKIINIEDKTYHYFEKYTKTYNNFFYKTSDKDVKKINIKNIDLNNYNFSKKKALKAFLTELETNFNNFINKNIQNEFFDIVSIMTESSRHWYTSHSYDLTEFIYIKNKHLAHIFNENNFIYKEMLKKAKIYEKDIGLFSIKILFDLINIPSCKTAKENFIKGRLQDYNIWQNENKYDKRILYNMNEVHEHIKNIEEILE